MTLYHTLMAIIGLVHAGLIFVIVLRPSFFSYPEQANAIPKIFRGILRLQNEFLTLILAGFAAACLHATNSSDENVILASLLLTFWTTRLIAIFLAATHARTTTRTATAHSFTMR